MGVGVITARPPRLNGVTVQCGDSGILSLHNLEELAMSQPDISNLPNCVEAGRQATLDQDPGPVDPLQFNALRGRLHAAGPKLPPLYREAVFQPFIAALNDLSETDFNEILISY